MASRSNTSIQTITVEIGASIARCIAAGLLAICLACSVVQPAYANNHSSASLLTAGTTGELEYQEDYDADERLIPSVGNAKSMCVLVEFPDSPHSSEMTPEKVSQIMLHGVHDFYQSSSYGLLNLDVEVAGQWYMAQHEKSYYEELANETTHEYARACLLNEAIESLDESVDFSRFDATGDGYIDQMYLLCSVERGPYQGFWWPRGNDCEYKIKVDGVQVGKYASLSGFDEGDGGRVAAHETGHALGLVDLYDVAMADAESFSVSDMMKDNTGDFNAYTKIVLGWIDPKIVSSDSSVVLRPSANYPEAAIVYPKNDESSDHFFVLEYVTNGNSGVVFDDRTENGGLRIWRVNKAGSNSGGGAPYIENVDWQNHRGAVMYDLGQDWHTSVWLPGSTFTPYSYPSSYLYNGTDISSGIEYTGISISNINADGESLNCTVRYEDEKERREFSYRTSYEAGNMLFGVISFPVETFLVGNDISLRAEDGSDVPVTYEMDCRPENQAYTKLKFRADLSNVSSEKLTLSIGAGTLVTSFGVRNDDMAISILVDESVKSSTTERNDTILGISDIVPFAGKLYSFKVIDGEFCMLEVNSEGETLDRKGLFTIGEGNVYLSAVANGDKSIILQVQADDGTCTMYKIVPEVSCDLLESHACNLAAGVSVCGGKLVTYRLVDSASDTYDICTVDPDDGTVQTVIPNYKKVTSSLIVSPGHLLVEELKAELHNLYVYDVDGELEGVIDLNAFTAFAKNENFGGVTEVGGKIGLVSIVEDTIDGSRVYCTILDDNLDVLEKKCLYEDSHYADSLSVFPMSDGVMIALSIRDGLVENGGQAFTTGRTTALFFDSDLEFRFSRMFDATKKFDSVRGVMETGSGEYVVYTDFESMHVIADESKRSISQCALTLEESGPYVHSDSPVVPHVEVLDGDTPLVESRDYCVSYYNNKDVGIGSVRVVGIGDYSGSKSATFQIGHDLEKVGAVEATCVEAGASEYWSCDYCGLCFSDSEGLNRISLEEVKVPALGHDYKPVVTEPTCTKGGFTTWTCSRCKDSYTDSETKAKGHKFEVFTPDGNATCEADGTKTATCANGCGTKKTVADEGSALGHKWGEWVVTKEPTCTVKGEKKRVCEHDEAHVETQEIAATGHSFPKTYTVDKPATCTEEGSESIHCTACGERKPGSERAIAKTAHAYGDWKVTKEPTCTAAGTRERVCASCGDKATESIKAKGHSYSEEYTVDKPATCTEEGSESIHCTACGEKKPGSERAIAKTAHAYGDWKVTKEPACTAAGSRERVCAECGDRVVEEVAATGHAPGEPARENEVAATCEAPGSYDLVTRCSACGEALSSERVDVPALGHDWDEGTVTRQPTATEPGERLYTCRNDRGHTRVEPIEPTGEPDPQPADTQEMHRLYNPNSGEHFYTADGEERDHLVSLGWRYEGVGWTAPAESQTPVHRLYNPVAGEHHYTSDLDEKDMLVRAGWRYEGVGWYSDDAESVPLYRQYNPNAFACNHNYTTDKAENDFLVGLGWRYEGIGWYGVAAQ